jgi:glycosyltransferase involved in cell wall biosynthesis
MGKNTNYIIWIGSVFNDENVLKNNAISPAGNKWQLNFIYALINKGNKVVNIGHYPIRIFPWGKFFVSKRGSFAPEKIRLICSSFLNLPFMRMIELNILYTIKIASLLREDQIKPNYVISYNAYFYNIIPLLFIKYIKKIKWISLVADPMNDHTNRINPFNSLASANVFLSWKLFISSTSKNKIHLDGGINRIVELNPRIFKSEDRFILYTGSISRHTGIEFLIQAFNHVKTEDVKLVICGKGDTELLMKALQNNHRISFLGMVNEQKLASLYYNAYMFINPRLIAKKTNNSNFPSKILEYMSYCKPVISTYTEGINPIYKEIIDFVQTDDPKELANKIDEIASWEESEYIQRSELIKSFIERNKTWSKLAIYFDDWVGAI